MLDKKKEFKVRETLETLQEKYPSLENYYNCLNCEKSFMASRIYTFQDKQDVVAEHNQKFCK